MTDITRIKEMEQAALKIKELFYSSITHEMRNPLNSIKPMSEKLRKYVVDEKGVKILNIIISSTNHLQNVIEDVLDMSRVQNN